MGGAGAGASMLVAAGGDAAFAPQAFLPAASVAAAAAATAAAAAAAAAAAMEEFDDPPYGGPLRTPPLACPQHPWTSLAKLSNPPTHKSGRALTRIHQYQTH